MTCDECSKIQESMEYISYIRVDKANVMLVGCKDHLKKLMDVYNLGNMTREVLNKNPDLI